MDTKVRGADTPNQHWEAKESDAGLTSDFRYSPEFKNPEELYKSEKALASYVKNNRMKY